MQERFASFVMDEQYVSAALCYVKRKRKARNPEPVRRNDVDWLRVLAVFLLFHFHTAAIFYPGMYVKNPESSPIIELFVMYVHQWHMPLFFLLAGMSAFYALDRRSGPQYVQERFKRLFVPLVFGTLALVPPQVYLSLKSNPWYSDSYLEFYPRFFNAPYPAGNFQWAHLWFLTYLLPYSLMTLPLFRHIKREKPKPAIVSRAASLCEKPWGILVFGLPLALIEAAFRPGWPGLQNLYDDWANFFLYLCCFVYGCLFCADRRFGEALERRLLSTAVLAVVFMGICLALFLSGRCPVDSYTPAGMALHFLRGWHMWFWLVLFLGLGQRHLTFRNRALDYAKEAALPVYILHQPVIVAIGFYVVRWQAGVLPKFVAIDAGAFFVTLLIYDLAVRRWSAPRFLMGMRSRCSYPRKPWTASND